MYYFQLLAMLLVLFLVHKIQIPDYSTSKVGICYTESTLGETIFNDLKVTKGIFEYKEYEDEHLLQKDVLTGNLDSGLIFTEAFDEGILTGNTKNTIVLYSTPFSVKAEVLKETVYASVFEHLSETLLYEIDADTYGNSDESRQNRLDELNTWYLESDALFRLEIIEKETNISDVEDAPEKKAAAFDMKTYPVQGTAGLFIFLMMYLAYGQKWEYTHSAVLKAFSRKDQRAYMMMTMLASATIPVVLADIFIIKTDASRGVLQEIAAMAVFLAIAAIWIGFLGKVIKNHMTFIGSGLAMILVNVICCPIFMDLSILIPALKYIRLLLPLGWYFIF